MLLGTKRFQIRRQLGVGGMGVVYEALDKELGALVALKTIAAPNPDFLVRLKREFRVLQDMRHPNLVGIGELFEDGGAWFLTMDLVRGTDFLRHVRPNAPVGDSATPSATATARLTAAVADTDPEVPSGRPVTSVESASSFDEQRLRAALRQLAEVLCYLHERGKVHRDIKPSNVLVTGEGRVVLLDFGLVADAAHGQGWTGADVVGTAAYMAPEQALGGSVGASADWYGVGVMLYQALTGQLPFVGIDLVVLMDKQRQEPPAPSSLATDIPSDLEALCRSLLRIEPARRPAGPEVCRLLSSEPGQVAGPVTASHSQHAPFVGREAHLELLSVAFEDTLDGRPVSVCVHGESGVGKSALVSRFANVMAHDRSAVVLAGRCYEREFVPYKAVDGVIDALASLMQRLPREEAAALIPRKAALLPQVFPVLRKVAALAQAPHYEVADPQELRTRLFGVLRELFGLLCERKRAIVVIDDMQWADEDSLALLSELIRPPDAPALLLLMTWRQAGAEAAAPECRPNLPGDVRSLLVERLAPEESRRLVTAMLDRAGAAAFPEAARAAMAEALTRESGGHPLFIEELVRHAVLHRDGTQPARLDDVIGERVAQLDGPARQIIEIVAIAGAPADRESVAQAAGIDLAQFGRQVAFLRVANFVRTTGTRGTDTIDTFHDRVRDAVLATMSPAQREMRHRELASSLETSGRADPVALAAHYRAAGEVTKAAQFAVEAAKKASAALAFDQAARLYRLALELPGPSPALRRELLAALGEVLGFVGRGAEAAEAYLAAAPGATAAEALDLQRKAAVNLLVTGHIDEGLATVSIVLASQGIRYPKTPLRALGQVLLRRLQLRLRGLKFGRRDESEVPARDLAQIDVCWHAGIGLAIADNIRGNVFMTRSLLLALAAGEPYRVARALAIYAGFVSVGGGPTRDEVERLLDLADDLANQIGSVHARLVTQGARGQAHYLRGEFRAAWKLSSDAEEQLRDTCVGVPWEINTARLWGTRSLGYLGEFRQLARRVPQLLHECRERGDLYGEVSVRASVYPLVLLAEDRPEQAAQEVAEAERRWTSVGFHVQHYYVWFTQASIALYAGEVDRALEQVRALRQRLRRSLLARVQFIRLCTEDLYGRAALAAAARTVGRERERLLPNVEGVIRRIQKARMPWSDPLGLALEAGLLALRDRSDATRERLRRAIAGFSQAEMALHAAATRRWLGRLAGGDERARLLGESEIWMKEQEVRNPERLVALQLPAVAAG